jgi:hypothetical protein
MTVDVTTLPAPIPVSRLEEKQTAKGDIIIIPDAPKEKPQEDEVLAAGGVQVERGPTGPARCDSGPRDFVRHTDRRRGVSGHPRGGTPCNAQRDRQSGIRQEVLTRSQTAHFLSRTLNAVHGTFGTTCPLPSTNRMFAVCMSVLTKTTSKMPSC